MKGSARHDTALDRRSRPVARARHQLVRHPCSRASVAIRSASVGRDGLGVHVAADARRTGAAGLHRMDASLADPGRPGRRLDRRGRPRVGSAGLSASSTPPARRRNGDRRGPRREGAIGSTRPARAAGRGRLHRRRHRLVRLRRPAGRARHQRAEGLRPRRVRCPVPGGRGHGGRTRTGPRPSPDRGRARVGSGEHGARCRGLHGSVSSVRAVSGAGSVPVARCRIPRARRPPAARSGVGGHRPAVPRRADGGAAGQPQDQCQGPALEAAWTQPSSGNAVWTPCWPMVSSNRSTPTCSSCPPEDPCGDPTTRCWRQPRRPPVRRPPRAPAWPCRGPRR